ncbi:unnamed protein product [Paramecium pentaurelia]|uniref:PAS domain-containing protein n=1 Tax=Paramecium pentaurelia TaxID=43138 RepID=A0A8S1TUK6_9CILI|nr:unnamed protein product [Paramecium pentaurelia]
MRKNYIRLQSDSEFKQEETKTFDEVKYTIFKTYFALLESKTLSQSKGILMILILNLQLIFMTANDKNTDLQSGFISSFLPISNYFLLYPVLLSSDSILFNMLFLVIALLVLIFLITSILYFASTSNYDNPLVKQLRSTWGFISELTDKILVVPVFGLTVGNIACNFENNQTECYSGVHIGLIIMSILCSLMLLLLEILYSYLFFNFTFKIKDSVSRNPSGMPIFFFIYRLGITIFQSLFDLEVQQTYTILVLLHLIFGLILLYDSLNNFPYHNKNVSKTQGIFASAYLWINATFIVLQLTSIEMLHENVLVIVGLGMAFFLKLFLNIRNYFVKVLMNSELDEIQSAVLLDLKIRNYNILSKSDNEEKKNELLLASLLKIHSDKCKNSTCPCKKRSTLIDPKKKIIQSEMKAASITDTKMLKQQKNDQNTQLHKDLVFVKHFIARMAKDGLNKFKDSKLLYLDYMYYRFEALRMYSSIYFEIGKFESKYHNDMSLSIEFCLYRLRARMKKHLMNRNQKSEISRRLQLENVKAFDEGIIRQKETIMEANKHLNDLWESLCEEKPDLSKLLDIGNNAIRTMQLTNDQYEFLLQLNNQSQDLKNLMTIYSNYLAYDDLLAKKIEKDIDQAKDMENDNSFQQDFNILIKKYQIFDKQSCVLSISSQLESLGQITWCSRNVFNVFGYDETDLKSMNINQMMPEPLGNCHSKILKNYYENARELLTTKMTHIWAIDRAKILFSANIFIKILPSLQSYDIVGFIHKLNQDDYIIADVDGMIYGAGRKVCQALGLPPEKILETKVNIQLIAPGFYSVFSDYFLDFDITANKQNDGKGKLSYDEYNSANKQLETKDMKQVIFIQKEFEKRIQSFVEYRTRLFKKFNIDLLTKEQLSQEFGQSGNDQKNIKLIKQCAEFKKEYAALFYKQNKKILIDSLIKMIKIKVQIKNFTYWNGSKLQRLKIIKVNTYEFKTTEYIKVNRKKIKEQGEKVSQVYKNFQDAYNTFKQKKMKQKMQEEQDNAEEIEAGRADGGEDNQEGQQAKGFLNMFKKANKNNRSSLLQLNVKRLGGKGKQVEDQEQLKQGILMTLFKPVSKKNKFKRVSKQQGSMAQVQYESKQFKDEDDEENEKKKIEATPEQLEAMRACPAVNLLQIALIKANILGQTDMSAFLEKKKKLQPVDPLAIKFRRIREFVATEKFKTFVQEEKKRAEMSNDTHSTNTDQYDQEDRSQSFDEDQQEERGLLQNILNNQGANEEEKAAMQSVSSSTQSLQAHNAQRMLREQLKNMQAPTILIVAHYTMVVLSLLLFSLIISQYILANNDFNGIKDELYMFERMSNYSDNLIEILDGYFTLQMINEGPLKNTSVYGPEWVGQFRKMILQNQIDTVQFFLEDYSNAGTQSKSGNDLRQYLFIQMNANMLVNNQPTEFLFNYENYVRLILNAANATKDLNLSSFTLNSRQDYFYFIYNNLNEFDNITDYNYNLITKMLIRSKDMLIERFYYFWFSCFGILLLLYILIYPIILKTKLKIQETLRIFTKISLADVEYYSNHYKMIFYNMRQITDTPQVLKKIEEEVTKGTEEKKKKDKENNAKNLARSRSHKGIQINKIVFFAVMTFWLIIFSGLIFVKDYFIILFSSELEELFSSQEQQHRLKYNSERDFVYFKNLYYQQYISQLNTTQLNEVLTEIDNENIYGIFQTMYHQLEEYSTEFADLVDFYSTNNTCESITPLINGFTNASQALCESILDGILTEGLLNFYQKLQLEMQNGLNQLLTQNKNYTELNSYISQQMFQDFQLGLLYAKWANQFMSNLARSALYTGIDNEVIFNSYFVIVINILIVLFLFVIWGSEYSNLKRNSRWVNGFILLIPSQLRSENKHINSFLKNQLKIQGLMYL